MLSIFDKDGNYKMTLHGSHEDVLLNCTEKDQIVNGHYPNHYISGGVITEIPDSPSDAHIWDKETKSWMYDHDQHVASVKNARNGAYPSIGDQLDMLWHAMDDGKLPKDNAFYEAVKAVKDANPKPTL